MYDFEKYKSIRCFGLAISYGTITLEKAVDDQLYLKNIIDNFLKKQQDQNF